MYCPQCQLELPASSQCCHVCGCGNLQRDAPTPEPADHLGATPALRTLPEKSSKPQIRLEVSLGHLPAPNQSAAVQARLENLGTEFVSAWISAAGVRAADGSILKVQAPPSSVLEIEALHKSPPQSFTFVAPSAGQRILRFEVRVGHEADGAFCGDIILQAKSHEPAAVPENVVIHGRVGQTDRNRIGDETNHINVIIHGGAVSESALQAETFLEVPLGPSAGRKRIAPGFVGRRFETPIQQLRLRIPDPASEERLVFVNAGHTLTLGKDDTNKEITLPIRTSPRANRDRISRRHATIRFNDSGPPIWENHSCHRSDEIEDPQSGQKVKVSTGGTRIPRTGQVLSEAESIPISTGLKLSLSDVFDLGFVVADAGDVPFWEYDLFIRRALGDSDAELTRFVHSVCVNRHDDFASEEEYVLFPSVALIGRDPHCTIRLDHPSISERHAWLWYLGQTFWIEPYTSECRVQAHDHQDQAEVDELIPLLIHHAYWLGDVKFFVERYLQPSLDRTNRLLK